MLWLVRWWALFFRINSTLNRYAFEWMIRFFLCVLSLNLCRDVRLVIAKSLFRPQCRRCRLRRLFFSIVCFIFFHCDFHLCRLAVNCFYLLRDFFTSLSSVLFLLFVTWCYLPIAVTRQLIFDPISAQQVEQFRFTFFSFLFLLLPFGFFGFFVWFRFFSLVVIMRNESSFSWFFVCSSIAYYEKTKSWNKKK